MLRRHNFSLYRIICEYLKMPATNSKIEKGKKNKRGPYKIKLKSDVRWTNVQEYWFRSRYLYYVSLSIKFFPKLHFIIGHLFYILLSCMHCDCFCRCRLSPAHSQRKRSACRRLLCSYRWRSNYSSRGVDAS